MRTNVSGGFRTDIVETQKDDYLAWSLTNAAGVDWALGWSTCSRPGSIYEGTNKELFSGTFTANDWILYKSPHSVKFLSASDIIKKNNPIDVKFEVYDTSFLGELLTPLQQVVKFECNSGTVNGDVGCYSSAKKGVVSARWIPGSATDVLYARMYDKEGNIIAEDSFRDENPTAITGDSTNITSYSAEVSCTFLRVPEGAVCGVDYWTHGSDAKVGSKTFECAGDSITRKFVLDDLSQNTEYSYCAFIKVDDKYYEGEIESLKTLINDFPVAITGDYTNITSNAAEVDCTFLRVSQGSVCGVSYRMYGNDSNVETKTFECKEDSINQKFILDNLSHNTKYLYCAFIKIGDKYYEGETKSFVTLDEQLLSMATNMSTHDNYVSPRSVFLVFPNFSVTQDIGWIIVSLYSDPEMTISVEENKNVIKWNFGHNAYEFVTPPLVYFDSLNPSSTYYYKVLVKDRYFKNIYILNGSFTTPSKEEITVKTNGVYYGGGRLETVKFDCPSVFGISEVLYQWLSNICGGELFGRSIGVEYSESPISDFKKANTNGNGCQAWCTSGTYYYRGYYTDVSSYKSIVKEDGSKVIVDAFGNEIGPDDSATWQRCRELNTIYGETKQFVIP